MRFQHTILEAACFPLRSVISDSGCISPSLRLKTYTEKFRTPAEYFPTAKDRLYTFSAEIKRSGTLFRIFCYFILLLHENIFAYIKVTFVQAGQIFTIRQLGLKDKNYEIFIRLYPFGGYSLTAFKLFNISLMCTH